MKQERKRRIVEIYFILYLAALILILPDGSIPIRQGKGTGVLVYQPEFVLYSYSPTLTCKVVLDSLRVPRIVSIDSVNTIFFTGDVEDVRFEFTIQDQSLSNTFLTLSSDKKTTTKYFRMEDHPNKNAALFFWQPPLNDYFSKTYLVKVTGTARTKKPDPSVTSTYSDKKGGKIVQFTTTFSLLLIYLNSPGGNPLFAQNINRISSPDTSYQFKGLLYQSLVNEVPTGKLRLSAKYPEVKQIAYQNWINTIYVFNANLLKDLSYHDIKVELDPPNNDGKAQILDTKEDEYIIHGITPSTGRMKVTVSIRRKYDDADAVTTFNVSPQPYEEPDYDRFMYPEITYIIDPKLPLIGKDTKAVIIDQKNIRAQSAKGEKFRFTPENEDVDKLLYLERYIDNELLGERLPIRILGYSEPLILDLNEKGNGEVELKTQSYGTSNKNRNEVVDLIIEGNASYQDLRGKITEKQERSFIVTTQYFRIWPTDPNKPFNFKVTTIDKRQKKSIPRIYRK